MAETMTPEQHETEAAALIERSQSTSAEAAMVWVGMAQVHATLALSKRLGRFTDLSNIG